MHTWWTSYAPTRKNMPNSWQATRTLQQLPPALGRLAATKNTKRINAYPITDQFEIIKKNIRHWTAGLVWHIFYIQCFERWIQSKVGEICRPSKNNLQFHPFDYPFLTLSCYRKESVFSEWKIYSILFKKISNFKTATHVSLKLLWWWM